MHVNVKIVFSSLLLCIILNQINTLFVGIEDNSNLYQRYPHTLAFSCHYDREIDDNVKELSVLFNSKKVFTAKKVEEKWEYKVDNSAVNITGNYDIIYDKLNVKIINVNNKAFGEYKCSVGYHSGEEKKDLIRESSGKVEVSRRETDDAFTVEVINNIFDEIGRKRTDEIDKIVDN
ncbi:uncharacterized protein LOC128959404 [Oppia nitens]|uniref:uncharacterized protein LOC128959404 n=1 Tax=Oppia nitens TaxID=1686743 RepID=UPI0023D9C1B6|nr:uncharacterized protein LOC128959404 [Oppia nitens]